MCILTFCGSLSSPGAVLEAATEQWLFRYRRRASQPLPRQYVWDMPSPRKDVPLRTMNSCVTNLLRVATRWAMSLSQGRASSLHTILCNYPPAYFLGQSTSVHVQGPFDNPRHPKDIEPDFRMCCAVALRLIQNVCRRVACT